MRGVPIGPPSRSGYALRLGGQDATRLSTPWGVGLKTEFEHLTT